MITGLISCITRVSDILVYVMRLSPFELRWLIFQEFGISCRNIFKSYKSILIAVSNHTSISLVKNFSLSLPIKLNWRMNICWHFVKTSIFSSLIIILTSIWIKHCRSSTSRFVLKSAIKRRLILFAVRSIVWTEHLIGILWHLDTPRTTIYLTCFVCHFVGASWQMLKSCWLCVKLLIYRGLQRWTQFRSITFSSVWFQVVISDSLFEFV